MFVEKIEVPAFRVLRNVVLEFDSAQMPRIFPLGSENGGGKSTLLQLLFALLHCSSDPERFQYLGNILATDTFAEDEDERVIARLTIRMNDERHVLEFRWLSQEFLKSVCGDDVIQAGFLSERLIQDYRTAIDTVLTQLERHKDATTRDWGGGTFRVKNFAAVRIRDVLGGDPIDSPMPQTEQELRDYLRKAIVGLEAKAAKLSTSIESLNEELTRVKALLALLGYEYIATYSYLKSGTDGYETHAFVCSVSSPQAGKTAELLAKIASKIFLLGLSNQQYLFLGKDIRKALLKAHRRDSEKVIRPQIEYLKHLDEAESRMPGFLAYDWLSVEPLVELFKAARDADFQQVVTTGKYGNRFAELFEEVSGLLLGKRVKPDIDPQTNHVIGINFSVLDSNGQETPISPEDLSQGELKRLMIYAWLKARRATDAFVLIDEIEASFHPDWQYGIIRDLQEWAPKNQYVLATHSYELCTALTPSHVRTLAPPLKPGQAAPSSEQK